MEEDRVEEGKAGLLCLPALQYDTLTPNWPMEEDGVEEGEAGLLRLPALHRQFEYVGPCIHLTQQSTNHFSLVSGS